MPQTTLEHDTSTTVMNREKLFTNRNLLFWYERLYEHQFEGIPDIPAKKILEVGSGTSPLKHFFPSVKTSDVLKLNYLDYVLDAHTIDQFSPIEEGSLDIITLTNVLHHLRSPLLFLTRAACKLKPGGKIIFTEPFFSFLSKFIYVHLHQEHTDFTISEAVLEKIEGPLSSANIALPYCIFERGWDAALRDYYDYSKTDISYFSCVSYMATGGISRRLWTPALLYKVFFKLDLLVSRKFPGCTASFFTVKLTKR